MRVCVCFERYRPTEQTAHTQMHIHTHTHTNGRAEQEEHRRVQRQADAWSPEELHELFQVHSDV